MDHKNEETLRQEDVSEERNGRASQKKGIVNTLYPPGPKPGAGPRMKNHCRKFWWCDLLVLAIVVLVIVLPIIYVAIPKRAQDDINASTLTVTSQEVTSPQADGIHLKLVSVAESFSKFHPTIEGFRAGFALKGKEPFLYADVPEVKAESKTDIVIDQDVKFTSLNAFKEYNKVVMGSESYDVYMSGKTKVRQKGLQPISVDYNKKVTMKGLNRLNGLNITDIKILAGDKILSDGSNMIGRVLIPNPSVITMSLGNVTMNLAVDGTAIGTSLLPDLVLKPGMNNCSMQSNVKQLNVLQMVRNNYTDGVLPLDIVGNSSIANGVHLEYFEEAIKSNTIRVNLDVGPALAAIGINVTSSE